MTDNKYLTRIHLQDFRNFRDTAVELPPTPGVLIVVGTNGLGKSSFFDGVEWCLTGTVDRFADVRKAGDPKLYLRRWHAEAGPRVALHFSDGDAISRCLDRGLENPKDESTIVDNLRSPQWTGTIASLQRYLLLTHFLGQSSSRWMTNRDAAARWEYLKGPAQSDWAISLATQLHGHGSSGVARAFETEAADLDHNARSIDQLLQTEALQFASARAGGAIGAEAAIALARDLCREIADLLGSDMRQRPFPTPEAAFDLTEELLAAVRTRQVRLSANVERAAALLREYGSQSLAYRQTSEELLLAREAEDAAKRSLEAAEKLDAERKEQLDSAEHERGRLTGQRESYRRLAGHQRELLASTAREENIRKDIEETEQALLARESEVAFQEKRRRLSAHVGQRLQAEEAELRRLAERRLVILAARDLANEYEQARLETEEFKTAHPSLAADLAERRKELQRLVAIERQASAQLEGARAVHATLSSAVATIAAHLPIDECNCPVCETPFPTSFELAQKVSAAANRVAPTLASIEATLSEVSQQRRVAEALVRTSAALDAQSIRLEENVASLASAIVASEVLSISTADSALQEVDQSLAACDAAIDLADRKRRRQSYWLDKIGNEAEVRGAWAKATKSRKEVRELLVALRSSMDTQRNNTREKARQIGAISLQLGLLTPVSEASIIEGENSSALLVDRSAQRAASAKIAFELAHTQLLEAKAAADARIQVATALRQKAAELRLAMGRSTSAWAGLQMTSNAPSQSALEQAQQQLAASGVLISTFGDRLQTLRTGYSLSLNQEAHTKTITQMQALVGVRTRQSRDRLRNKLVERQGLLLAKARQFQFAKQVAQSTFSDVKSEVENFNRQHLKPLNTLMEKINRAILTDPDAGLGLSVGRSSVRQVTKTSSGAPDHVKKLDPQLVHSEGQMAALAVSMLCAASLTFPWSRWPALFLDDPLQHNDVVHASAFADMIRNLVHIRKYQVFLSTHDFAQSDFLARKFRAGGIATTVVTLIGHSEEGTAARISGPVPGQDARVG